MKIFAMSDIHGCLQEFEAALELVDLSGDNKLILLGDYIHSGADSYGVLKKIIKLQQKYGNDKVIALMGNHEELVIEGRAPIQESWEDGLYDSGNTEDDGYICFMQNLPLYHVEENIIFVHAGIDEEVGEEWEWESTDRDFLEKYPAEIGCQTAHCGRCKPRFVLGEFTSPIVPYRNLPQTPGGMTADCRSLV